MPDHHAELQPVPGLTRLTSRAMRAAGDLIAPAGCAS
jgi:hypothetical protein